MYAGTAALRHERFQSHTAAVSFDKVLHYGPARPGPLGAVGPTSEERIENSRQNFRIDPGSRVVDEQFHVSNT